MGIGRVNTGGGGSGGTLVVTAPVGVTVTATKDGKTYTRTANAQGVATFKGLASGTWQLSIDDATHDPTTPVAVEITADYTITLAFFAAYINITYPSGSTCKATCGTKEITAPDTSGTWALTVPNAGTWTIYATDGTDEAEESVTITSDGQSVSVELSYWDGTLYDTGDQYTSITGGWKVVNGGGGNSSIKSNYMLLSATSQPGTRDSSIYTNNKIDTTGFSTLYAEMDITSKDSEYNEYGIWVGISNTNTEAGETNYVKYTRKNTIGTQTITVDLSNHQGEYYIKLCAGVAAANVTKVYLG